MALAQPGDVEGAGGNRRSFRPRSAAPGFFAENTLRPLGRPLVAENPPLHVFRLNGEDPVNRHENVVNLRGATLAWQHEVVAAPIDVGVEPHPHAELGRLLAKPAFEDRRHLKIEAERLET